MNRLFDDDDVAAEAAGILEPPLSLADQVLDWIAAETRPGVLKYAMQRARGDWRRAAIRRRLTEMGEDDGMPVRRR